MSSNSSTVLADDAVAVRSVPQRITAAWADNDADAFAAVFTEDATLILPGDIYLTSREQIRSFMTAGFAGPYRGTRVYGEPLSARFLGTGAAVVVTKGGVLAPGETEVAAERTIRATWVLTKQDGEWLLAAYQNTPV
jgi:uncharacterized protein (TIGR02246 family)